MPSAFEMEMLSASAFRGLEVSVQLCVLGTSMVFALLLWHLLFVRARVEPPSPAKNKTKKSIVLGLFLTGGFFLFSCAGWAQAPGETLSSGDKYPRFGLPEDEARFEQGRKVYNTYCMGCHGVKGDGQGPAAEFLNPKPRNFLDGEFRFSSRPSGDVPTDQDLFRTITEGLHGSSMPPWNLMPESDRWAVVAYLKTFAPNAWKFAPGAETSIAEDPYLGQPSAAAIKRGETAYHGMAMCYSCHAAYVTPEKINEARGFYGMPPLKAFRENLGSAVPMQTSDGSVIVPPDFVWNKLKRGTDLQTLYHVIGNGISGTPMPTWKGILPEEDLWGIVYYVKDLAQKRPSLVSEAQISAYYEQVAQIEKDRVAYEEAMRIADREALKKSDEEKKEAAQAALVKAASAAIIKTPEVEEPPRV